MGLPVQVPLAAVSVWPWVAVPLIAGAAVLVGAGWGAMTAVWEEVEGVDPPLLLAVTTTRTVWPTSVPVRAWLLAVAPEMLVQLAPEVLQSCH